MKNSLHKSMCFFLIIGSMFAFMSPSYLHAKNFTNKMKEGLSHIAKIIEEELDECGISAEKIQYHMNHYPWKGVIENKNKEGPLTLQNFTLNGHSRAVIVKPGATIECEIEMGIDAASSNPLSLYQVVIGLKKAGPQVIIGNSLGTIGRKSVEKFQLIAPKTQGVYEVRYRLCENLTEKESFYLWKNVQERESSNISTIGLIIVKS
ncbi:hypothetical protein [Rhabdochlamydiaceae symbiont of Dictyostelium giganteum]|uniref:hypothetical protein n=1 Tax=Rhabdochlamydiaceae symbiont of Dictyostelium giganteum TaxID=3342349 RepID=UPI00384A5140